MDPAPARRSSRGFGGKARQQQDLQGQGQRQGKQQVLVPRRVQGDRLNGRLQRLGAGGAGWVGEGGMTCNEVAPAPPLPFVTCLERFFHGASPNCVTNGSTNVPSPISCVTN